MRASSNSVRGARMSLTKTLYLLFNGTRARGASLPRVLPSIRIQRTAGTRIRGAYGIFYETINADIIQNTSQPFNYTFTINAPYSLADPLRGQAQPPLFVNFQNP